MNTPQKKVTLTKLLTALAIIGFIGATPTIVKAAPAEKATEKSAVIQIKSSLREIAEAGSLWEKAGGCSMRDCLLTDNLVAAGKLPAAPQLPPDIGIDNLPLLYSTTERPMGGCGAKNIGASSTTNLTLLNVSEQFCRDYNNSVGLGRTIVGNCNSSGDCIASGSTNPYHFPKIGSSTFCFLRKDIFAVVWMTDVSSTPCPDGGF